MASGLQPLAVINLCRRLMDLVYTFDPGRFHLGTLCKRGHRWPGTDQSLRRTFIDKRGRDSPNALDALAQKLNTGLSLIWMPPPWALPITRG